MTTRTSFSTILHLFLVNILVSSCIVSTAATLEYDEMLMLPAERKIAKRRILRRKLGSSFKPTKQLTNNKTATITAAAAAAIDASGYDDDTLATRMVQRMTPTISTGADQRRKLKRKLKRQRTIHHT
jgi:hypothetical protein